MKTNLIKVAILMVALLAGSCRKNMQMDNVVSIDNTGELSATVLTEFVNPANPDNPFDSIGVWHNEMLDFVLSNPGNNSNPDEISNLLNEYAMQRWGVPLTETDIPVTEWQETDGIENLRMQIVEDSNLSGAGKEQLLLLLETVPEHVMAEGQFSYSGLRNKIILLEQQWEHDATLPVADTNILLMAASVARHSAYYWSDNGTTPQIEPWNPGPGQPGGPFLFRNVVRFIATVQWDMGGFISGYAGGGLRDAAGKAAGASSWIHGFFDYGVIGGW